MPLNKLSDWLQPKQGWERGDLGHGTDSAVTELCGHGQVTSPVWICVLTCKVVSKAPSSANMSALYYFFVRAWEPSWVPELSHIALEPPGFQQ